MPCRVDYHSDMRTVVHSWGSPRVGEQRFVDAMMDSDIVNFRWVSAKDAIPTIPSLQNYYKHAPLGLIAADDGFSS